MNDELPGEIVDKLRGLSESAAAGLFEKLYVPKLFAEEIYSPDDMRNAFIAGVRWSSREIRMEARSE